MIRIPFLMLALPGLLLGAGPARANQPDLGGMKRVFAAMEQALKAKNEAAFKAQWHPEGYAKNLVGGSGLAGYKVFGQGTRKGWYLKPDFAKLHQDGRNGLYLVPCDVWSTRENRAVDHVWALPVWDRTRRTFVILGAGEQREQVVDLARRHQAGKPLAPPPRP